MVKTVSKKKIAKAKNSKTAKKTNRKSAIDAKLNSVIALENKLLKEEKKIETEEGVEKDEESKVENILKKEETDLEKLEKIETEIKTESGEHPLAQVTFKDITKGLIGAFIGLAIHYTFTYGVEISQTLTMTRATILFPLTFIVGLFFIYATGFRKIEDKRILLYMPIRLLVLYVSALAMSMLVLYIFYPNFGHNFEESYKMVAGVMLAAVVGACTADLLGKD